MWYRLRPLAASLLIAVAAQAEEPVAASPAPGSAATSQVAPSLAVWRSGSATIAGHGLTAGSPVTSGAVVTAGAAPVRLDLLRAPGTMVVLAPGSQVHFSEDAGACLVWLDGGVVQLEVSDRGPYQSVQVVGGAMVVRVTGTLFVVERDRQGSDFLALVHGTVKVDLRDDVRRLLKGATGEVELHGRQALSASIAGGLGQVADLSARPQLPISPNAAGIRDQAEAGLGTDWQADLAALATDPANQAQAQAVQQQATQAVDDQVQAQVSGLVIQTVTDDVGGTVNTQVQEQVVQGLGGTPLPLPGPPPHP